MSSEDCNRPARWSDQEDEILRERHGRMSIKEIASELGRSVSATRNRASRLGLYARDDFWSQEDVDALVALYGKAGGDGVLNLSEFARLIGRNKANVCRKAKTLGLQTNQSRSRVEVRAVRRMFERGSPEHRKLCSKLAKQRIADNGHPRGMLGKKHTEEVKRAIAEASSKRWNSMSYEEQNEHTDKAMKAKIEKHGTVNPRKSRGSWKAGWREIGGKKNYYRSRWEANYARYLEWLKARGHIKDWQHEPETFWFEAIKRGVRSYKPDFRVWENDGSSALHEVKGWMDSRSRTTIKRMRKYHPHETLIVIDGKGYRSIRKKVMGLIPGWEDSSRDAHA